MAITCKKNFYFRHANPSLNYLHRFRTWRFWEGSLVSQHFRFLWSGRHFNEHKELSYKIYNKTVYVMIGGDNFVELYPPLFLKMHTKCYHDMVHWSKAVLCCVTRSMCLHQSYVSPKLFTFTLIIKNKFIKKLNAYTICFCLFGLFKYITFSLTTMSNLTIVPDLKSKTHHERFEPMLA